VPELVVLNGVAAGTVFALGDVPAVVGRSPEAHLHVGDPWISSLHAMFERRDDGMWVVDLESRNGVFLGEERVGEARLTEGAVVRLGRTEIRFSLLRTCTAEFARIPTDTPPPPSEREAVRGDGTLSTQLPLAREREDPYGLALRSATVLRMAIDAVGDGGAMAASRVRAAVDAAAGAALGAGGVVARLAGVGVLALFGLGGADPEDAATALGAARAARAAVRAQGGLDLRAAVESGAVLAGNTGGGGGFELAALGPTAERAERLLAFARRGEILAGPSAGAAAGLRPDALVRFGDTELQLFRDLDA
jgi:class 3 adenylate cyclase